MTEHQTICLSMIVKNEASIIRRCLDSVRPHIDSWAIVDTGSTDGTQGVIREHMRDMPGELIERPWVDFAHGRNEARELAHGRADYLMFIDADEVFTAPIGWTMPPLEHDHHLAAFLMCYPAPAPPTFARWFLSRSNAAWRWVGTVDEGIEGTAASPPALLETAVIHSYRDGALAKDPQRRTRDVELLEREVVANPTNPRVTYFLARSYLAVGNLEAAHAAFGRHVALGSGFMIDESRMLMTMIMHAITRHGLPDLSVEAVIAQLHPPKIGTPMPTTTQSRTEPLALGVPQC